MNRYIPWLTLLLSMPAVAASAPGPDRGKELHDAHCFRCHDTAVYTRDNRRIRDIQGLEKQVRRCELSLGLRWFDEDVRSVVEYLDEHFYHFRK